MAEENIHIKKWPHSRPPSEEGLRQTLQKEGLEPYNWSNEPGYVYNEHTHDYHKTVFVVSGSITFGFAIEGTPSTLHAGDRLELPAGVAHNAVVGPEGVVCLEAHRDLESE